MPTQAYFDQYPSFPDDVQTADLQRVSFAKLLSHDAAEAKILFEACRAWGFIVLDFEGCEEGQSFLQMAADMFEIDKEVNSMDAEELMKYAYKPPHSLFGYVVLIRLFYSMYGDVNMDNEDTKKRVT